MKCPKCGSKDLTKRKSVGTFQYIYYLCNKCGQCPIFRRINRYCWRCGKKDNISNMKYSKSVKKYACFDRQKCTERLIQQ